MKNDLETLVKNLKTYMEKYDINQTELGEKMGVKPQTISKWCRGESFPNLSYLNKLCVIFHCTRSDLMDVEQTPKTIEENRKLKALMDYYDKLNDEGYKKVLEFLEDMNPKFFKED